MLAPVEEIARRLREAMGEGTLAHLDVFMGLWADPVEIRHDPPLPVDGFKAKAELCGPQRTETLAMLEAIPDYHKEDVDDQPL